MNRKFELVKSEFGYLGVKNMPFVNDSLKYQNIINTSDGYPINKADKSIETSVSEMKGQGRLKKN